MSENLPIPAPKAVPGNPGKRCTLQEYKQRIDTVIALKCSGYRFNQICRQLGEKYGIGYRQAEFYISAATKQMIEHSGRPRNELFSEAYNNFLKIMRDPETPPNVRGDMQKEICKLFGLYAPQKFQGTMTIMPIIEVVHAHQRDRTTEPSAPNNRPAALTSGSN